MEKANEILSSDEFKKLVKKRWIFSLSLTATILAVYFGFILTLAFNKSLFAIKVFEGYNVGMVSGFGILFFAWLLTGLYVYWANGSYDKSVENIKSKLNA